MKLIDLGWCMARLDTTRHKLTIVSPADVTAEGGYGPGGKRGRIWPRAVTGVT